MNDIIRKTNIKNMIYEIRGKQVMLDSELAKLYGCINGTKDINKAVKRNIERFPEDFYFQLSGPEFNALRFQTGTSKTRGGRTYLPYVFTEQGVAMLASVLKTEVASKVSVNIMRAFVEIKKVNNIHDRFIIIDDEKLYHVGASLKDLGKKCFAINKMNKENIDYLMNKYSREI